MSQRAVKHITSNPSLAEENQAHKSAGFLLYMRKVTDGGGGGSSEMTKPCIDGMQVIEPAHIPASKYRYY